MLSLSFALNGICLLFFTFKEVEMKRFFAAIIQSTNVTMTFSFTASDCHTNTWGSQGGEFSFQCYSSGQDSLETKYHTIAQFIEHIKATHSPLSLECNFKLKGKINRREVEFQTTELEFLRQYLQAEGMLQAPSTETSLVVKK